MRMKEEVKAKFDELVRKYGKGAEADMFFLAKIC